MCFSRSSSMFLCFVLFWFLKKIHQVSHAWVTVCLMEKNIDKSEVFLNLKNVFTECQTAFGSDSLPQNFTKVNFRHRK